MNRIREMVLSQYTQMQQARKAQAEARARAIEEQIPEIAQIDHEIATLGIKSAAAMIKTGADAQDCLKDMKEAVALLKERKNKLLEEHGVGEGYADLPYACDTCRDTGMVDGVPCRCYRDKVKKLITETASRLSGPAPDLESQNFSKFDFRYFDANRTDALLGITPLENMKSIYGVCKEFCDQFSRENKNLFLYGAPGTGKTFMTCCITKELSDKGFAVLYQSAYKLFSFLEDLKFDRVDRSDGSLLKEAIYGCDLLVIDDFGTEYAGPFAQAAFFDLLNSRLMDKKSTVISSNMGLSDIEKTYSGRVSSRIAGEFMLLRFAGEDIRCLKQKERYNG
ncbi:MAG: hypothetical protein E7409_03795 [Ruminococcaceae bacterium]|nr:hypothetical protein [Oscillospiraceae bacterium]